MPPQRDSETKMDLPRCLHHGHKPIYAEASAAAAAAAAAPATAVAGAVNKEAQDC